MRLEAYASPRRSKTPQTRLTPFKTLPRVEKAISKLKKDYNCYTTKGSTDMLHVAINKFGVTWTVDLNGGTCSCCEWQISGIPCIHATTVINPRRDDWAKYCSPMFTMEAYRATYKGFVVPMEDSDYWPEPQHRVIPPPLYRPPGRPRHNRIKNKDEVAPEKRPQKKCSKCGMLGHNKKTCKGAPATGQNGKRVTPRTAAEGPILQQENSHSRPPLIIPAIPVQRTTNLKRGGSSIRGSGGKKRKTTFIPPRPSTQFTPAQ